MSDIVERLRERQASMDEAINRLDRGEMDNGMMRVIRLETWATYRDAADEITRLRASLALADDTVDALRRVERERDELRAEVERHQQRAKSAERLRDDFRDVLMRNGFVPCDAPACNCGSWHARYGLRERWEEIKDAVAEAGHPLTNENGNKLLNAVRELIANRDGFRAKYDVRLTEAHELRADNAKLREALRKQSVFDKLDPHCTLCMTAWDRGGTERHAPGCLAAQKEGER